MLWAVVDLYCHQHMLEVRIVFTLSILFIRLGNCSCKRENLGWQEKLPQRLTTSTAQHTGSQHILKPSGLTTFFNIKEPGPKNVHKHSAHLSDVARLAWMPNSDGRHLSYLDPAHVPYELGNNPTLYDLDVSLNNNPTLWPLCWARVLNSKP